MKVQAALFGLAALLALQTVTMAPEAQSADSGFSFVVYGDSRSMFYLPYKSAEEPTARQLLAEMFELVLPKKEAETVVEKHVKFIYDPANHELSQIVMPFDTMTEVTTLTIDKGWVTKASVEDVKLLPGVHRTMFELQGGQWVAREVAQNVKSGRVKSILHTGDLVWWSKQASAPSENQYWKLVNDNVMKQLPASDGQMRAAGLGGRSFPAAGNHEVWQDPNAQGFLSTFPYLKQWGV